VSKRNINELREENPGINIMHLAARFCMKEFFKKVFESQVITSDNTKLPGEVRDGHGLRPLHYAALTNNTNRNYNTIHFIHLLITNIQMPVDKDAQTDNGETALHFACTRGNLELVKLLVENGASMKLFDKRGKNAFHNASRGKSPSHLEIIKYLDAKYREGNERKVPVKIKTKGNGYTCLHYAARALNPEMFKLLISLGADITDVDNVTKDVPFGFGFDPNYTHNIIDPNHYEVVEETRSEDDLDKVSLENVQIVIDSGVNINNSNINGITPLYILCHRFQSHQFDSIKEIMNIDLKKLFIDNGAYPYAKVNEQQGIMCYKKVETKKETLIVSDTLGLAELDGVVDPEATNNMTDYFDKKWGSESLKYMFEKNIDGFKSYLNKNQNMSTDMDETKSTLLHNLVFLHRNTKCIDYVKAFLEAYPDVDLEIKNGKDQTVFDIATERKDKVMEDLLLNSNGIKQKRTRKGKERKEREEKEELKDQQIKEKDDKLKQEQSKIQEKENQLKQEQSKIQELQQKLLEKEKLLQKKPKSSKKRSSKRQKQPSYYEEDEEDEDDEDDFIIEDEQEYERPKPKKTSKKRNTKTTKKLKKKYSRRIVV
jgi:ankyrin repeat protein